MQRHSFWGLTGNLFLFLFKTRSKLGVLFISQATLHKEHKKFRRIWTEVLIKRFLYGMNSRQKRSSESPRQEFKQLIQPPLEGEDAVYLMHKNYRPSLKRVSDRFFFICSIKSPQCADKCSNFFFDSDFPSPCFDVPKASNFPSSGVQTATPKTGDWERLWRQFRIPSLAKNRFLRRFLIFS